VSMLDVVTSWLGVVMSWYLGTGEVPPRGGMPLSGGLACYRVYRAGDGRYLAVGALEPRFWRALCHALELPDLVDVQYAPDRQEEMAGRLSEAFGRKPRDEWVASLSGVEACVGPVNDVAEAMADPQAAHRGVVAEVGGVPVGPGPAIKVSDGDQGALRPAPELGEHTDEVLGAAGFSPSEVAELRAGGVL
jgi:alpha-methylacyl-CoA racemase